MRIYGVDFTSRPTRRKPIRVAQTVLTEDRLVLEALTDLPDFRAFEDFLQTPGPWVAGFDLPFGLPRDWVLAQGWPDRWPDMIAEVRRHSREALRARFKAWCDARPVGSKFAHRATDGPSGSSPSMKWVNPPVAWMFLEGAPRLLDAGLHLPGLMAGDSTRIGFEAYPGFAARMVTRASYKSDEPARQTPARREAREVIVAALEAGRPLDIPLSAAAPLRETLCADAPGDSLDAVLCAVEAAWGWQRREQGFGLPPDLDPLEGWTVSVPMPTPGA